MLKLRQDINKIKINLNIILTLSLSRSLTISLFNWRIQFDLRTYIRTANIIIKQVVKKFEDGGALRGPGTEKLVIKIAD